MVEGDGLENRYSEQLESRVRIPPSPPYHPETLTLFGAPLELTRGEGATGLNTPLIAQGGRGINIVK